MMGVVYEARDSLLDRVVALKTIHLAFNVSEEERKSFEARFLTEARSAARLSHPGIVVVHDVGRDEDSGMLFMALEYVEGRPLSALYGAGAPMDWRAALRIVGRVARALHHAHQAGVVHRDIKPANIMVADSGEPKVMDFGLAKLQTSQLELTSSGQFFGTPLYMSPEQALGKPLDGRSDLFSLGSVSYALVTGQAPFVGDNIPQIFLKVAGENPVPPSLLNSDLPPGVDEVMVRAMAKEPVDRYPDGGTLAQDVEDVLAGRLPRNRVAVPAAEAPGGRPGPARENEGSASGALQRDLDTAFGTLVPDPPADAASARTPAARPPASARAPSFRLLAGAGGGLLVAGLLLGVLGIQRWGAGTTEPAAVGRAGPAAPGGPLGPGDTSTTTPAEPGTSVPATLSPDATRVLARAIAAHLGGDLERSRDILEELLAGDPALEEASRLLQRVEAELWARDTLPLEFRAAHNHRIGSCRGRLSLEAQGITYSSSDHGRWHWSFAELRGMTRKSPRELELVTDEREALRLGGAKRYDFQLLSDPLPSDEWDRFVHLARGS
jgi:hypothetical protein